MKFFLIFIALTCAINDNGVDSSFLSRLSSLVRDGSSAISSIVRDSTSALSSILPIASISAALSSCSYRVNANSGPVVGCKLNNVYTFKGIPFAAPPVGSLRFGKTKPIQKWSYTIDATKYGSACVQPFPTFESPPSEDCLFLNIWTPTINSSANLPVMVYINGGGFDIGSGGEFLYSPTYSIYDGTILAREGVVVVTFNYRLGVFGFLTSNRSDAPGNAGVWDQVMAINWTKVNIRAFGGNPNDLTVFGESAGSMSASILLVSNLTKHWFTKAILQSGTAYGKIMMTERDESVRIARAFAANSTLFLSGACRDPNTWVDCLRRKPWPELVAAQITSIGWVSAQPWYNALIFPFSPIYGDQLLPVSVNRLLRAGKFDTNVSLLIGHNEMEAELFAFAMDVILQLGGRYNPFLMSAAVFSKSLVYDDIKNLFMANASYAGLVADKYTDIGDQSLLTSLSVQNLYRRSAVFALSDYTLNCPTVLFGEHARESPGFAGHVFQYRLTYANSKSPTHNSVWAGAEHIDDLPLVFGLPLLPGEELLWTEEDRALSLVMVKIWTYFAKHGKTPSVNGHDWPEYAINANNAVNAVFMELNPDSSRLGTVFSNRYRGNDGYTPAIINNCTFWDDIIAGEFLY